MADFSFLSSSISTPQQQPQTPIFSSTSLTSSLEYEEAYISLTHLKNNPQDFIDFIDGRGSMIELVMEFWSSPFTKHHTFIIRRVGSYLLEYQKLLSKGEVKVKEEVGKKEEEVRKKEEELEKVFEFIYTNLSGKECSILSSILNHFPHFYKNLLSSSSHNPIHNPNQNHKNEVLLRIMKKLQNLIQNLSKSPKFQSYYHLLIQIYKEIYTNTPIHLHPLYTEIFFTTIDSLTTTTHSSMIGDWHMSVEGEEEVENTVEFGYLLLIKGLAFIDRDRGMLYLNTFLSRFKSTTTCTTSTISTTTSTTTSHTTSTTTSNSDHFEWLNGQWIRLKEIDQILLINIYLHYTSYPLSYSIHIILFEQLLKQIITVNSRCTFRVYECLLLAVPFIIENIQNISESSESSCDSSSEWRRDLKSQILNWVYEISSSKKEVFMYLYLESLCFMKILIIQNTKQSLKTSDLDQLLTRIMKLLKHPEFKYRITSEFFSTYADMIMSPFISGGDGYSVFVFEEMNRLMVEYIMYFLETGRRRQMEDMFYIAVIECLFSILQYQHQQQHTQHTQHNQNTQHQHQHTQNTTTQHTTHNNQQQQEILSLLLKEYTNNENIQYLQHLLQTTAHKLKHSPLLHSIIEPFLPQLLTPLVIHPQYPIRLSTISLLPFLTQNHQNQNITQNNITQNHHRIYTEIIVELWFDKIYIVRESVLKYILKNGYTNDLLSRIRERCDSVGIQKLRYFGMFERMLNEGYLIEEKEEEEDIKEEEGLEELKEKEE